MFGALIALVGVLVEMSMGLAGWLIGGAIAFLVVVLFKFVFQCRGWVVVGVVAAAALLHDFGPAILGTALSNAVALAVLVGGVAASIFNEYVARAWAALFYLARFAAPVAAGVGVWVAGGALWHWGAVTAATIAVAHLLMKLFLGRANVLLQHRRDIASRDVNGPLHPAARRVASS